MNLHYFEPMAGWFPALSKTPHLCTIGVKTGPDWKLKRRFLFSDVFSAKWRPLRFFHQRCTDLNSPSRIISRFSPFWYFFKIPFSKFSAIHWNDLSVRCWLIVWWNWFIHVFTVQPLPHYISSHLIFTVCTVLYQLQLYFISSYCAIAPIVLYQLQLYFISWYCAIAPIVL